MEDVARNIFVNGLRNAHAMEKQALSIMKPQLELEQHIRETEGQIASLEEFLNDLGEDQATLKDMALRSQARWPPVATRWQVTRS